MVMEEEEEGDLIIIISSKTRAEDATTTGSLFKVLKRRKKKEKKSCFWLGRWTLEEGADDETLSGFDVVVRLALSDAPTYVVGRSKMASGKNPRGIFQLFSPFLSPFPARESLLACFVH